MHLDKIILPRQMNEGVAPHLPKRLQLTKYSRLAAPGLPPVRDFGDGDSDGHEAAAPQVRRIVD
jgi:hypothetical protein